MAFLHSVIGDNTIENREHLEKLGYKFINLSWDGKYIFTSKDKNEAYYANGSGFGHINCIGNPQLFQAVSAMRDDSDMHQLFFIEGLGGKDDYWLCDTERFNHESENLPFDVYAYSKCDLYELQAHFQRL